MSARIPDLEPINEYESLCHRCGAKEYVYGGLHTEEACRARKPVRVRKPRIVTAAEMRDAVEENERRIATYEGRYGEPANE